MSAIHFGNPAAVTTGLRFGGAADDAARFQTFTLHEPMALGGVAVELRRTSGSGQSDVLLAVRDVAAGVPGATQYALGRIAAARVTTAFGPAGCRLNDVPLAAGQYALVLTQERPQSARYEWATGPRRAAERSGRGPSAARAGGWVDESALGSAWLEVHALPGEGETIDVTHGAETGNGFGAAVDEVRRYQTFYATRDSRTVHGADVRVRRIGGTGQSDLVVDLYATAGGRPTGAPLATALVAAPSVGTGWTTVHAPLHCPGLEADVPYAVVLGQRTPQAARYEWARAEVDAGLRFGKWTGSAWVDESGLGDGWLKVWGDEARPVVRGEHAGTSGVGFGSAVDETRRYQVVHTFPVTGAVDFAVWGVDLKVRRAFGTGQSDLWVGLYHTGKIGGGAGPDFPNRAAAWTTVPASRVGDDWTIVHVPLWWAAERPGDAVAIVVGQVVPQAARYEWAMAGDYAGAFGKLGPTDSPVDESRFGSAWFRLWCDSCPAEVRDPAEPNALAGDVVAWRPFGGAAEAKRFQVVPIPSTVNPLGQLDPEVVGVEVRLRRGAGAGQSDVVVELYETDGGAPAGLPVATAMIPSAAIGAEPWGSTHRVLVPCRGLAGEVAVALGQRTPQAACWEWATTPNPCGRAFGAWNGTAWVDQRALGAGWVRVWARRHPFH